MYKFSGNLHGNEEYIFRQSVMGAVGHIVNNYDDIHRLMTTDAEIRVDTLCGKNLKYGSYSSIDLRSKVVRNACEYCFTEWDVDERTEESRAVKQRRVEANNQREIDSGLPF